MRKGQYVYCILHKFFVGRNILEERKCFNKNKKGRCKHVIVLKEGLALAGL